jgi:hypothetical protein
VEVCAEVEVEISLAPHQLFPQSGLYILGFDCIFGFRDSGDPHLYPI